MQDPSTSEDLVEELYLMIPDFRRAYDEDGMTAAEFDAFGATARTPRVAAASLYRTARHRARRDGAESRQEEIAFDVARPPH